MLTENRNGLVVEARLTQASGYAEWEAGLEMVEAVARHGRVTLGGDRGYDVLRFVEGARALGVTPHLAQNTSRR